MQLHSLTPKHPKHHRAPVGRGGKRGKTSGHGGKGQTARAGHKIRPEMRDLIKKLPKRRGHGRNRSRTVRTERLVYTPVSLATLETAFSPGAKISPAILLQKGMVRRVGGHAPKIKILGTGGLSKAFTVVHCAASASARMAIEKAGGTLHA
ncbi:MAG: uL15 family ribosomal protein [bacterium]|nr:uL15 family ribosomal protein [bacterium]